ncbi:MAG: isochorismatase family protein [Chromatiales bacterium]|nr:isochorismatase family protein [Chromatiales bacterium]
MLKRVTVARKEALSVPVLHRLRLVIQALATGEVMDKLDKWSSLLTAEDKAAYAKGGFGQPLGFGENVALLNIDTTHMFVDPAYPLCGALDESLLSNIQLLTDTARELGLPIYYSRRDDRSHPIKRGIWNLKLGTSGEFQYVSDPNADAWPAAYAPREEDLVVLKNKPSCFFETPLESWLRYQRIDTIVAFGTATSGCVRAAVVDAFSHNFRTIVAQDACADRSDFTHNANLFDMDMKYADVLTSAEIVSVLRERSTKSA